MWDKLRGPSALGSWCTHCPQHRVASWGMLWEEEAGQRQGAHCGGGIFTLRRAAAA